MGLKTENKNIHFNCVNKNKGTFEAEIFATYTNEKTKKRLKIVYKIWPNPSPDKTSTRVKHVKIVDDKGEELKDASSCMINTELIPQFSKMVHLIDNQYLSVKSNITSKEDYEDFFAFGFDIDLKKGINIIESKEGLSTQDIEKLMSVSQNINSLYNSTIIKKLEKFSKQWKDKINLNSLECEFQQLLFENKDLFPFIFGINNILDVKTEPYWENFSDLIYKREYKLNEELDENSVDIWNKDFIIELKRPSTKMFASSKNNAKSNILGITSNFVSALNQVKLYVWKNNREKKLAKEQMFFTMTKGILIIGSSDEFNEPFSKEKWLAYQLFSENEKIKIYTFDEISKIIDFLLDQIRL